ncbi:MAG: HEAT repeat domain-containing protein [Psychrobacter sp.]|nr:HEAT repeat domain-containing protein [Psychrobacter sp.]
MEYSEQELTPNKIDALTTDELIIKALDYREKLDACCDDLAKLSHHDTLSVRTNNQSKLSRQRELLEANQDTLLIAYWDIVSVLHTRGSETEFQYCKTLVESPLANERILAADILGQLCYQDKDKYYDFVVTKLIKLLDDNDDDVVASAATALGHRVKKDSDFRAIAKLINLANHSNKHIRQSVVFALGGVEHPEAIKTLIKLCDDKDVYIRDWALFSLGSLIETDTAEIRETLKKALMDDDFIVRGEALVGLAQRGDCSIINQLTKELDGEEDLHHVMTACELLADSSLLPHLQKLKKRYEDLDTDYDLTGIDDAIEACSKIK